MKVWNKGIALGVEMQAHIRYDDSQQESMFPHININQPERLESQHGYKFWTSCFDVSKMLGN